MHECDIVCMIAFHIRHVCHGVTEVTEFRTHFNYSVVFH